MLKLKHESRPHLDRIDLEASSLGPNVESVKDDNGLRNDLLRQPEQYAGSLGELGAGKAKGVLEMRGNAIKLGAGSRELLDCSQGIG